MYLSIKTTLQHLPKKKNNRHCLLRRPQQQTPRPLSRCLHLPDAASGCPTRI